MALPLEKITFEGQTPEVKTNEPEKSKTSRPKNLELLPDFERFEDNAEARVQDYFDILLPKLTPADQKKLTELISSGDSLSLPEINKVITDPKQCREVTKALAILTEKKIKAGSGLEKLKLFFTPGISQNGFSLCRALKWLKQNSPSETTSIVYPGSASDSSGWLKYIGASGTDKVYCVSLGGPAGEKAPEKVLQQGVKAEHIMKSYSAAIDDGDLPNQGADAMILDLTGVGIVMANNNMKKENSSFQNGVEPVLREGGILIVANNHAVEGLLNDKYRKIFGNAKSPFAMWQKHTK